MRSDDVSRLERWNAVSPGLYRVLREMEECTLREWPQRSSLGGVPWRSGRGTRQPNGGMEFQRTLHRPGVMSISKPHLQEDLLRVCKEDNRINSVLQDVLSERMRPQSKHRVNEYDAVCSEVTPLSQSFTLKIHQSHETPKFQVDRRAVDRRPQNIENLG